MLFLFRDFVGILSNNLDNGNADGEEHERGGGVHHPHTDGGAGDHKTADERPPAVSDRGENRQRHPFVEVPPLDSEGNHETTHEEIDNRIGVRCRHHCDLSSAEEGEHRQRQNRRHRHRDRFGAPPDGHPDGAGSGVPCRLRHSGWRG